MSEINKTLFWCVVGLTVGFAVIWFATLYLYIIFVI